MSKTEQTDGHESKQVTTGTFSLSLSLSFLSMVICQDLERKSERGRRGRRQDKEGLIPDQNLLCLSKTEFITVQMRDLPRPHVKDVSAKMEYYSKVLHEACVYNDNTASLSTSPE